MDISVILPTYCERDNIANLISAIETSLLPLGREIEILVVDDNSPDGTAEVIRAHPARPGVQVRCFVRTQERGLATAIRYGIQQSSGDRIVVMDTDFNHSPTNIP
ncbi:glycosyltransferase, partial [bacterium]|nr:glycosyltransferase [bacterium]